MRIVVSLVVPTYRTNPDHLRALVESVDRLTLPAEAVELIFVDDGSPDDTFDRVRELAAGRPQHVARQIPNSGWPCRPRNIGTELAHGDYVLYLDHDDVLYPDGLEHAYCVRGGARRRHREHQGVQDPRLELGLGIIQRRSAAEPSSRPSRRCCR